MIKRVFDVLASVLALIILSPLFIIIALVIFLERKGPVFFLQERIGKNEKPFRILKFRTMVHRQPEEIDQMTEAVVSNGNDTRITKVGRLLRNYSLDEIPQLINIINGDMSIVGPRPIIPEQKPYIPPGYLCRFNVPPGLTGLAQVRGRRSLGWLNQLAYDREYVETRGFICDITIVLKTAWIVLVGTGVYGGEGMNWRSYAKYLDGRKPQDKDVLNNINKLQE